MTAAPPITDTLKEARSLWSQVEHTRQELENLVYRENDCRARADSAEEQLRTETNWKVRVKLGAQRGASDAEQAGINILRASLHQQLARLCTQLSHALVSWLDDEAIPTLEKPLALLNEELAALTARRDAAALLVKGAQSVRGTAHMLRSENGAEWQGNYAVEVWPNVERTAGQVAELS